MPSVNNAIQEKIIEHSTYVERLKSNTVAKLVALLNRTEDDLIDQIRKRGAKISDKGFDTGPATTKRLNDLLASTREINRAAYAQVSDSMVDELQELAKYEATWSHTLLTEAIPASIVTQLGVTRPDLRSLYSIVNARPFQGRLLKESLAGVEDNRAALVRDTIRQGLVEGEPIDQITRRLKGTSRAKYADGLLDRSRREMQALTRTAVSHTMNTARDATYADNRDILKGLRWTSTLDGNTSPICQARDTKMYPVNSGPRPPAHWNCRSTMTPITKSYRELGLDLDEVPRGDRASMDGYVPEDLNYGQWLGRKPAAFQDEVLGKSKGQLFRNGGLKLDKFVNRAGNEMNLAELKIRHPAAFEKAGLE